MTRVEIRDLRSDDLPWLAEAERTIFGPAAWSESLIGHDYRYGTNRYRGVEVDGSLAAYAIYGFEGDAFHLMNLAVLPEHRGAGLARALLDEVIAEAARLRADDVWLEVAVDNERARALYDAYGFELVRVRRRYYQPGDIDAHVMRRPLTPYEPAGE